MADGSFVTMEHYSQRAQWLRAGAWLLWVAKVRWLIPAQRPKLQAATSQLCDQLLVRNRCPGRK